MARPSKGDGFLDSLTNHYDWPTLWAVLRYALGGAIAGVAAAAVLSFIALGVAVTKDSEVLHWTFVAAYFYGTVLVTGFLIVSQRKALKRRLESNRFDLACAAIAGAVFGLAFQSPVSKATINALSLLTAGQLTGALVLPLLLLTIFIASPAVKMRKREQQPKQATFFSDAEILTADDDLLDVRPDAERFAERVLNGGSRDSMVFGLDAPWGAGKSSFINFCEGWWEGRDENDVVVYRFNPLQYEDRKHLLSKFVDGLISAIRGRSFIPELQPTVSQYAELFKTDRKFSLWGIEFSLGAPSISVESAHAKVSKVLATLPTRVIVIVDDLDRMEFAALKDILFVVKKCFSFPNISFVLCYDTQNIAALESSSYDSDKISEFLEKFVNVKQGLFPTAETLNRYLTRSRQLAASHNPLSDPKLLDQAVGGLTKLYSSPEYVRYLPLVGDVRKIKRLLNILVLLDLAQTDFQLSDFDPLDLLHLLLIYINSPNLFRTLYNAETGGRNHFVSLVRHHSGNGGSNYTNPDGFGEFIASFNDKKNEHLLLTKLFDVARFSSPLTANVSEIERRTLACFNDEIDGKPGNLSRYLQLIVSVSKPPSDDSFRSLISYKNQIAKGMAISSVYSDMAFHPSLGEARYEQLWRVITNSLEEFDSKGCAALISDALQVLPRHSQMEMKDVGLGFRQTLVYFLLKLLDTGGWQDDEGQHRDNTDANVLGIARWIYGEGEHRDGIIDTLMAPDRGVLGLHDAIIFRLYCCADRAGSLFSLTRAVGLHSDPDAPTSGLLTEIVKPQMREMSQFVFRKFKEQYIAPRKNIFSMHSELTPENLCGDFYPALQTAVNRGELTRGVIEDTAARTARTCLSFSVYQLSNRLVASGIGCGYYDETGRGDEGGIHHAMNAYFFDFCFSEPRDDEGLLTFLDFALGQMRSDFGQRTRNYTPDLRELLKIFEPARLRSYWLAVRGRVKSEYLGIDRQVKTYSYTAHYSQDLGPLVTVLDGFADS